VDTHEREREGKNVIANELREPWANPKPLLVAELFQLSRQIGRLAENNDDEETAALSWKLTEFAQTAADMLGVDAGEALEPFFGRAEGA